MTLGLAVTIISAIWVVIIAGLVTWFFMARSRSRQDDPPMYSFGTPRSRAGAGGGAVAAGEADDEANGARSALTHLGFDAGDDPDETRPVEPLPPAVQAPPARGAARDEPFGLTTQEEYERLAAESFQAPPAAALGEQGRRAAFSWSEAAESAPEPELPPVPLNLPEPPQAKQVEQPGADERETQGADDRGQVDDDLDRTILVPQRRTTGWVLVLPDGTRLPLEADVVVGRRPAAIDGSAVLQIVDPTRTISKSHVRMRLRGEHWYVTDLASTNGLWLLHAAGVEEALQPHQEIQATPRMRFGTLTVELHRGEA